MNAPKISVLIPLYNRRHYIEECINSVLMQTFRDYEIIIRDNGSTDGGFEFVQQEYAPEISIGKLKLIRNNWNAGLVGSSNRLMSDAAGEYITFLHSDDVLLPHALEHLYEVAKTYDADIVHESYRLETGKDGVIQKDKLEVTVNETNPAKEITVMSDDPMARFRDWFDFGTFHDMNYNLLRKKFMLDNDIFLKYDYKFQMLWVEMLAKVFVKTPLVCYIRRDAPDSGSRTRKVVNIGIRISQFIKMFRDMDEIFEHIDFFKDNEHMRYAAKARMIYVLQGFLIEQAGYYENGITPELHHIVSEEFKKFFGDDYFYPTLLFHWINVIPYGKPFDRILNPPSDE